MYSYSTGVLVPNPRKQISVKLDKDVHQLAKLAAAYKDVPINEYISEAVRSVASRDVNRYQRAALGGQKGQQESPGEEQEG